MTPPQTKNAHSRTVHSPRQIADMTGLSIQTVYNHIAAGRLRAVQPGGKGSRVLITDGALAQFLGEGSEQ